MSTLGSSVITKSSKKFGPKKAPLRRPAISATPEQTPSVSVQDATHSATHQSKDTTSVDPLLAPSIDHGSAKHTNQRSGNAPSGSSGSAALTGSRQHEGHNRHVTFALAAGTSENEPPAKRQRTQQSSMNLASGRSHVSGPDIAIPSVEVEINSERAQRSGSHPFPAVVNSLSQSEMIAPHHNLSASRAGPALEQASVASYPSTSNVTSEAIISSEAEHRKQRGRRPKRLPTPENGETITIVPSEARMLDLCVDNGTGRKSLRERELREMDRTARLRREAQKKRDSSEGGRTGEVLVSERGPPTIEHLVQPLSGTLTNVPRTLIINGQIQIDESSLQIDRHAAAALTRDGDELEPIDENDLSRKITSGSWLKRDKSGGWNSDMVELFYKGLRMFGTDFELISQMFPGKSRHTIKLKFVREERENLDKIKAALMGEKMVDVLQEFERMTGREYEDPSNIEGIMAEDRRVFEEEQAAEAEAIKLANEERERQAGIEKAQATRSRNNGAATEEEDGENDDGTELAGRARRTPRRQPGRRKGDLGLDGTAPQNTRRTTRSSATT